MRTGIIGAGIAGLAAAKVLRLLGWDVQIYEQARELAPLGAGILLSANALRALRSLDLLDAVVTAGQPIRRLSLLDADGRILHTTNYMRLSQRYGHCAALALHRRALQATLLSQLPPSIVQLGKRCIGAQQIGRRVSVRFDDGTSTEVELLMGCDGIHSVVRKSVFPESYERFAGYSCWRGIAEDRPGDMEDAHVTESWGQRRGRRIGLVPLVDGKVYWFACLNAECPRDPELMKLSLGDLQEIFTDFHPSAREVLRRTPAETVLRNDITDLHPMDSLISGTIVLLGDAAHGVTPDLGQGAGLALEDVAILGVLLQQEPITTALSKYDSRRRPRTREIARYSRRVAKLAQLENPLVVRLRNLLVRAVPKSITERQLHAILDIHLER
jgi:2-polyprenyl-6-methoxyphenol hydroxylase-like FAD-dependent oxidoreductase